jgi:hypothetical protein
MAAFSTSAEVLTPAENQLHRTQGAITPPGFVLADVLRQSGGAYRTAVRMSGKFRDWIRAVAQLTADDELRRIAGRPEVPVSLENCRQLDPQTRFVTVCRLDVSAAETPRWPRVPPAGVPPRLRGELRILDLCRGAHMEERRPQQLVGQRAREVIRAVAARGVPEALELAEAYRAKSGEQPNGLT